MTAITGSRSKAESLAEWAGVLTGPAAWTVHLWFNYGLEEFLACVPGAQGRPTFLGLDVRWWVAASNTVLAAATLAVGLFSLARYRRLRGRDPSRGRVAEWMALAGVLLSALFFVIIVAGLAPAAILGACTRSP